MAGSCKVLLDVKLIMQKCDEAEEPHGCCGSEFYMLLVVFILPEYLKRAMDGDASRQRWDDLCKAYSKRLGLPEDMWPLVHWPFGVSLDGASIHHRGMQLAMRPRGISLQEEFTCVDKRASQRAQVPTFPARLRRAHQDILNKLDEEIAAAAASGQRREVNNLRKRKKQFENTANTAAKLQQQLDERTNINCKQAVNLDDDESCYR